MTSSNAFKKGLNNPYGRPLRGPVGNINAPDVSASDFSESVITDYKQGGNGAYFNSIPTASRHYVGVSDFQESTIVDSVDRRTAKMPEEAATLWKEIQRFIPKTLTPQNAKRVNLFMSKRENWDMANQLAAIRGLDRPLTRDEQIRRHTLETKMSMAKTHLTRTLRSE